MLNILQKKNANGTKEQLQKYSQDYEKQPKEKVVFIEDLFEGDSMKRYLLQT